MAFTVVQTGNNLKFINEDGVITPNLTLPSGITLSAAKPARFLRFDNYVILVNTPSLPLLIDSNAKVRLLVPRAPRLAPVVSGVSGGTLSGTYTGIRYTFIVEDENGNLISESDYSPASGSVTLTNQFLKAAGLDISPDEITGRRLYRPTAGSGGTPLFQWVDLDGNVLTEVQDDLSDAGLSLVASPILGNPPFLTHIAEFRGRLFGVAGTDIDNVRYTEAGVRYSWPEDNILPIPVKGADNIGITAFAPRREALGIGKENTLIQVTGTGSENPDGNIDFDVVILSRQLGISSQESVSIYRDTAYFLWKDGVYEWGTEGIKNISDGTADGHGNVSSWFNTDSYFDRNEFGNAFGQVDPIRYKYRLFLKDPDGALNWVEYDLQEKTWWGPHKTAAFTPKCTFYIANASETEIPTIGSVEGDVFQEQTTRTDSSGTGIEFDVIGKRHDAGFPDQDKYFGELSMLGKAQAAGTLTITCTTGELNATISTTKAYDMTKSRQRISRIGAGKHTELRFRHAIAAQDVELYGYVIDPVHILGRR